MKILSPLIRLEIIILTFEYHVDLLWSYLHFAFNFINLILHVPKKIKSSLTKAKRLNKK